MLSSFGCFVESRNYSILSLTFIASSFRVTEDNLVFETVQSGPYSSFESSYVKGLTFIFYRVHVNVILNGKAGHENVFLSSHHENKSV